MVQRYKYFGEIFPSSAAEFRNAIADYDQTLRLNPTNVSAYWARGDIKLLSFQPKAAIADYDQVLRLITPRPETCFARGNIKLCLGQPREAITDYDQALCLSGEPMTQRIHLKRGIAKTELGQYTEAIMDYDQALGLDQVIALDIDNASVIEYLGVFFVLNCIIPDHGDASVYFHRGRAKAELGQYTEAIVDYDQAIDLGFQRIPLAAFVRALVDSHETDGEGVYVPAGPRSQEDGGIYFHRGRAKAGLGQYTEAIADYNQALKILNFSLENNICYLERAHIHQANYYFHRGHAKAQIGQSAVPRRSIGRKLFGRKAQKHIIEAIADYDRALRIDSSSALVRHHREIAKKAKDW